MITLSHTLITVILYFFVFPFAISILAKHFKNIGLIDIFWAPMILIWGLLLTPTRIMPNFYTLSLLFWAFRLSGFLFWTRVRFLKQDLRYEKAVFKNDLRWTKIFSHYLLQWGLAFLISLPLPILLTIEELFSFSLISVLVLLSLWGETLADWQLFAYQKNGLKGVCQQGLWSLSRHPNYFFELLLWWTWTYRAFLAAPQAYYLWLCPLTLSWIFLGISIPISEKMSLEKRGLAYQAYQKKTSMLIPWFRKKEAE